MPTLPKKPTLGLPIEYLGLRLRSSCRVTAEERDQIQAEAMLLALLAVRSGPKTGVGRGARRTTGLN